MTDRVAIGRFGGAAIFRVSHPGVDVLSTPNNEDFAFHEGSVPLPPLAMGELIIPANSDESVIRPQAGLTLPILRFFGVSVAVPTRQYIPNVDLYALMPLSTNEVTFYNHQSESVKILYFFYKREFA